MSTVNAQQHGNVRMCSVYQCVTIFYQTILGDTARKTRLGLRRFGTVAVAACSRTQNRELGHCNRSGKHTVRVNVLQTCKHCRETYHNRTIAKNRAFATHTQPTQCSHGWLAWRASRGTYRASACVYLRIELLQAHTTTQNACDGCLQPKTASEYLSTVLRPNGTASSERSGRRPTNPTIMQSLQHTANLFRQIQ
jgi:hypothetical protein